MIIVHKKKISFTITAILLVAGMLLFSCRSNKQETHPAWNTNLLLPLITTNLNINQIVADSLIHKNADSSISLVYKTNLYNLNLAQQVVDIPDTTLIYDFKLDSLHLANRTIVDSISLGQIAEQPGSGLGFILLLNGTDQNVPALNDISTTNYAVNANSFFQTAHLETGTLTVSLHNGFPVTISQIVFQITNQTGGSIVVTDTFLNIAPDSTQSKNINLAGETVDGSLYARIVNMSTLASIGKVLIDTANSLVATLSISDVTVYSATAVFPAQDIVNQSQSVSLASSGGAELKKVKFLSGDLQIILKSTIDDSIHFNYILPSATDANGNKINLTSVLPPAPPKQTSSYTENYNLAGYTFDMTGPKKDTVNTFYNQLIARIDSTGTIESISLNDSLYVSYAILNVVPSYLNGYTGRDTLNYGPVTIPFSVFKNIKGGKLSLKNINVSLGVQNGIGANGRVIVHQAEGINSLTNSQVPLTGSMINRNLNIPRATDNPLTPTITNYTLTPSNSDVLPFIQRRKRHRGNPPQHREVRRQLHGVLGRSQLLSLTQVEKMADAILASGLKFNWDAAVRVDLFGNPQIAYERRLAIARKMKAAGCVATGFSLESGDEEILTLMNKKIKAEYFTEQIRVLREAGIACNTSVVFGYPIETKETIKKTFDMCLEAKVYPSIGFLLPLPYTGMYDYARKNGFITDEDAFLTAITERQDICLNMTKLTDEEIMGEIKEGAKKLNRLLELGGSPGFSLPMSLCPTLAYTHTDERSAIV